MTILGQHRCESPEETFALGQHLGAALRGGEMILLEGGLGAGKTLFTKGVMDAAGYDVDEVTSPSFTLVNLYRAADFDVYHIDLWRNDERADASAAVGLDEILEDPSNVVIVEWPSRLRDFAFPVRTFRVAIEGDGDDPRVVSIDALSSAEKLI